MIDWVSALIEIPHKTELSGGFLIHTSESGEIIYTKSKFKQLEGSYSSKVSVKSESLNGVNSHLYVSGNIVKFFQGHNVFGSIDLNALIYTFLDFIVDHRMIEPINYSKLKDEHIKISRLDFTENFRLDDSDTVNQFLASCELNTTMKYRGRGVITKGTLYYGKHSTRWALKLYNKYQEVIEHKKEQKFMTPELKNYCNGLLRIELVLRGKELKKLNNDKDFLLSDYNETFYTRTYKTYLEKLEMNTNSKSLTEGAKRLTRAENSTYLLYRNGYSLVDILPKSTFYRHKKAILQKIGINIATNNVVSIVSKLPSFTSIIAEPAIIPKSLNDDYYFTPEQRNYNA